MPDLPAVDVLRRLASEHVPDERVDDALRGVEPAWRLETDPAGEIRIGGPAALGPDEQWPRNARGIPLTFLALVPTVSLPLIPEPWHERVRWPHQRDVLRVFGDLVASPYEGGPVLILPAKHGAVLVDTEPPPLPDPWPVDEATFGREGNWDDLDPDERIREFPATQVTAVVGLVADENAFWTEDHDHLDPDADGYESFAQVVWSTFMEAYPGQAGPTGYGPAKIFGAPWLVQDDPRYEADVSGYQGTQRTDWTVLLELHIDGSAIYICVLTAALADGTYEPAFSSIHSD